MVPLRLQPLWSSPRQSPALQTFPSKKRERRWGRGAEGEGGEEARSRERGGAQEGAVAICARGGLSSASSPPVLKWEGVQIPSLPSGLHFLPLKCKSLRHPRSLEGGGCATIVGGRQVMITVRVCNSFFFPPSTKRRGGARVLSGGDTESCCGTDRTREPQEPK